jgi:hypothetical protein
MRETTKAIGLFNPGDDGFRRETMSNMFYSLGATLAQAISREDMVGRGVLRLSIMDSVEKLQQMTDVTQATAHIQTMNYQDWKAVLEGPVLSQRLMNLGITEPSVVVARLKQTLADQQSLLTMTAY